jgi:regulator of replication initiation timing
MRQLGEAMASTQSDIRQMQSDIREMQSEVKGLQVENRRILQRVLGDEFF